MCSARKTYNPRLRCDNSDIDVCESCSGPAAQMSSISLVKAAPVVADLSMLEVQGSEGAQGVRLAPGATVVLSVCNTGRGEIKAEGVARGSCLPTLPPLWYRCGVSTTESRSAHAHQILAPRRHGVASATASNAAPRPLPRRRRAAGGM